MLNAKKKNPPSSSAPEAAWASQLCPLLQHPLARLPVLPAFAGSQAALQPCSLSLVHYAPKLSQSRQTTLAVPVHHSMPWFLAGFYTQIKIDRCFISEISMAAALHLPTGKINHSFTLPTHTDASHNRD